MGHTASCYSPLLAAPQTAAARQLHVVPASQTDYGPPSTPRSTAISSLSGPVAEQVPVPVARADDDKACPTDYRAMAAWPGDGVAMAADSRADSSGCCITPASVAHGTHIDASSSHRPMAPPWPDLPPTLRPARHFLTLPIPSTPLFRRLVWPPASRNGPPRPAPGSN